MDIIFLKYLEELCYQNINNIKKLTYLNNITTLYLIDNLTYNIDNILITKKGPVILTSGAPKDIDDIERQMQ